MGISKSQCSWILKGVKSCSGNTMAFWKTNFNMPVPPLFDDGSDYNNGFMCSRYGDIGWSSQGLQGFCAGYEVALADSLYRWCVSDGSCLNGIACTYLRWYRGATCLYGYGSLWCINLTSSPGWACYQWAEGMTNTGIAGWEICCNGTYCTLSCACTYSGGDVSIPACAICLDFGCVPPVSQCGSSYRGYVWVDGTELRYINANQWEHKIVGTNMGFGGNPGSIWIDNSHYLHWTGCDGIDYRTPWRICQFCSSFTNGSGPNPSPGSSYAGALWVDNEFGWTHLAYIGCDGNKYITGGANYPYTAP